MENVIGEIWSELEEGSVMGCPFPLLIITPLHHWHSAFVFITFAPWEVALWLGALKATDSGTALPGAAILHVRKPQK